MSARLPKNTCSVIEHIPPKFARPALVASESAWPSTRCAAGLAYRAACRHARRSTAKPRDAVRAPHGHVGPAPPTGAARGRARPCAPLCRRLTRLTASFASEPLPNAAFRRPKRLVCRFSSLENRFSELPGLFSPVSGQLQPAFSSLFPAARFGQNAPNAAAFPLTAITYFPDEFPISHNLLKTRNFPIRDVRDLPKAASFSNLG